MTYSQRAKQIFEEEIEELHKLESLIDDNFDKAIDLIQKCKGKLVVMGIGKTGIIGHKIASSLASTGTPAVFVNAAEAVHGDLGIVNHKDIVLLVSNSGSSSEILNVIEPVRKLGCTIIAMTGDVSSRLAQEADLVLSIHVDKEACPLGLAPTTSTTATALMGDALMVCLMEKHQFKAENFAVYHPGGALGRQLLGRVKNLMTTNVPRVKVTDSFKDLVHEMSDKHLGMTMVYEGKRCIGIITDGDLRRAIQKYDDLHITARDVMTPSYKHIHKDALLSDALAIMDKFNITTLAVTEKPDSQDIIGIISIHHIIDFN
ncbi:MAG: KpsF/GutQ family sugar-phosphate isomerase [Paludibacteraceae bacterium]|nr:KpsF/GutQ family sugar-phosphate isomerase [Paludibacteraceae bacterium]